MSWVRFDEQFQVIAVKPSAFFDAQPDVSNKLQWGHRYLAPMPPPIAYRMCRSNIDLTVLTSILTRMKMFSGHQEAFLFRRNGFGVWRSLAAHWQPTIKAEPILTLCSGIAK
jgi:hypothetical protein